MLQNHISSNLVCASSLKFSAMLEIFYSNWKVRLHNVTGVVEGSIFWGQASI